MTFEVRKFQSMSKEVEQIVKIEANGDGWMVPTDPANSDYQAYLAWLEEGEEPEQPEKPETTSDTL